MPISFQSSLPLDAGEQIIKFTPYLSGIHTGFIKFVNLNDDSYFWYSVKLNVSAADSEAVLLIKTIARIPKIVNIAVKNHLDNISIDYKVDIVGSSLQGESSIVAFPKVATIYQLKFLPSMMFLNSYINQRYRFN